MKIIWGIILLLCLAFPAEIYAQEELLQISKKAEIPALIPALRVSGRLNFCGEPVPMHDQEVRERLEKELLLTLWDRAQVVLWIKRSGRYMPVIERTLRRHGLPNDLKYVAVVESALMPHIGSSKGARGFWQFMKATGRRYGLAINSKKDERRNIYASTKAACLYLNKLYSLFGSWSLACAAYNLGEKRLGEAISSQDVDDYYQLYIPKETMRYVFKILAAKMILSDPTKYGFQVKQEDLYKPLEFDRINISCSARTPIRLIARAAGTYFKKIKDLNPELKGETISSGSHTIAIPKDSASTFHERYEALLMQWEDENKIQTYVVRKGDNLTAIADRFDISLQSLLIWNDINPKQRLYPGKELVIYQ